MDSALLSEIHKGLTLKHVKDKDKNDRSQIQSSTSKPAGAPTGAPGRATPSGGGGGPMILGQLFANGVPKLRPSGGVTPAPAVSPSPPPPRKPPISSGKRQPPPPPPPPSQRTKPAPPPPPPRVGCTGVTEPIVISPRPKTIRVTSAGDQSADGGAAIPQRPAPPPPPPPLTSGRCHPPPPPPLGHLTTTSPGGNVAALSAEFDRRFQFLQECDLPAPPQAYTGRRTYRASRRQHATGHPAVKCDLPGNR